MRHHRGPDPHRQPPRPDEVYHAVESKDARFDGCFFTTVRTTGIYCRPSCPAVTPKRQNVEFFPTAAATTSTATGRASGTSPTLTRFPPNGTTTVTSSRAMRLVADGAVDPDGVAGLADNSHYSERHLNRLMVDELGTGPIPSPAPSTPPRPAS